MLPDSTDAGPRAALKSLTLRGALAMALAFGASKLGVALPDGVAQQAATAIADLIFLGGALAVGVGRARARAPLS
jgi:hypothetical protein